jgi:hypothetical protein
MHTKKAKAWVLGILIVFLLGLAMHDKAHALIAEANVEPRDHRTAASTSEVAVVPPADRQLDKGRVEVAQVIGIIYADEDGDGVIDQLDKCPETPKDFPTDKHGCPALACDINGDGKIGLEEVIYLLQILSNQRPQ